MSRHELFNPDGMMPAVGFSYGAIAAPGRQLYLAGITGHQEDGSLGETLADQFDAACRSVVRVIEDAGGTADDLVSMTIYTTDVASYRSHLSVLGEAYRDSFGKHYPPMALIGVSELMDPAAMVELICVAVVPSTP